VRSVRVALAALLLAGCAGPRFLLPELGTEFELAGRIAVSYRSEATSGNIAWRHSAQNDELLLSSPLGQGIARIARVEGAVTLTTSDGRDLRAASAEALTEQALGFRLPLAGLTDWVRGRAMPAPAAAPVAERRDADGRLAELMQSGWTIRYLDYADGRPSRMTLSYPGLEIRLAIAEWK
jgi:outer membrane lipoprotein LolB